jgi:D-3-phosphoglycerate dehydrogenase / 2-oxoglutarate reductase
MRDEAGKHKIDSILLSAVNAWRRCYHVARICSRLPRMKPFTVLVTSPSFSEEGQRLLHDAGGEMVFMEGVLDEQAVLAAFAKHKVTAAVLRGPTPFTAAVFGLAKDLKIVSKNGAGIDSVDLAAATEHGVAVMITNGANADSVAEHALALMLALVRELPRFDRGMRNGVWRDPRHVLRGLRDRAVGIVGYGQIGQRTAQLANACGAKVIVHSRTRSGLPAGMEWEASLDGLLERADVVSLHTPLTEKTRGFIGAPQLARMKPGALLINTSRGKLVDESALIAALKSGTLAGAGLDVFAAEPPDFANPLFSLPNVLCTPHIASITTGAEVQMGIISARNILHYLRGEIYDPANFVNPQVFKGK